MAGSAIAGFAALAAASALTAGPTQAAAVLNSMTAHAGDGGESWARWLGFIALILACINIFGGFLVTERMLAMYKKKG